MGGSRRSRAAPDPLHRRHAARLVASDFIRSALDLFAYERDADHSLVLAGGVPAAWLEGEGIAIAGLGTRFGKLDYTLRQNAETMTLHIAAGALPPGGFVFAWPCSDAPGTTHINGNRAQWHSGELHIPLAPADVVIAYPAQARVNRKKPNAS